jgi:hypothetical protein
VERLLIEMRRDGAAEDIAQLCLARRASEWHEDIGNVLWWELPISEPPYVGTPLDIGAGIRLEASATSMRQTHVTQFDVGGWPVYWEDWETSDTLFWTPLPGALSFPQ